jgi:hypothetical protein
MVIRERTSSATQASFYGYQERSFFTVQYMRGPQKFTKADF